MKEWTQIRGQKCSLSYAPQLSPARPSAQQTSESSLRRFTSVRAPRPRRTPGVLRCKLLQLRPPKSSSDREAVPGGQRGRVRQPCRHPLALLRVLWVQDVAVLRHKVPPGKLPRAAGLCLVYQFLAERAEMEERGRHGEKKLQSRGQRSLH